MTPCLPSPGYLLCFGGLWSSVAPTTHHPPPAPHPATQLCIAPQRSLHSYQPCVFIRRGGNRGTTIEVYNVYPPPQIIFYTTLSSRKPRTLENHVLNLIDIHLGTGPFEDAGIVQKSVPNAVFTSTVPIHSDIFQTEYRSSKVEPQSLLFQNCHVYFCFFLEENDAVAQAVALNAIVERSDVVPTGLEI